MEKDHSAFTGVKEADCASLKKTNDLKLKNDESEEGLSTGSR